MQVFEAKVEEIKILEGRQRQEFDGLEELAESLRVFGQIQPIVVDDEMNLIAGERRLRAAKLLGWELISAVRRDGLDAETKQALELEENLRRRALTPFEELQATKKLHDYYTKINTNTTSLRGALLPGAERWTVEDTAMLVGRSRSPVSADIALAGALALLPEEVLQDILLKAGDSKAAIRKELEQRLLQVRRELEAEELTRTRTDLKEFGEAQVVCIDAIEGMGKLASDSIDLICTDPPYGVLEDSVLDKDQENSFTQINWNDSQEEVLALLDRASLEFLRILKPSRFLFMFCAFRHFYYLRESFSKTGFHVRPLPLFWNKTGVQPHKSPSDVFPMGHETILFAYKPPLQMPSATPPSDVISFQPLAGSQKEHKTEKPVGLIARLIDCFIVKGGLCLDPFCGSGSTLVAATQWRMNALGFDKDIKCCEIAERRLREEKEKMEAVVREEEEAFARLKEEG